MNGYPVGCIIRSDRTMTRTIVVGIGNPILGDDAIGLHVVKSLKKLIDDPTITIEEAHTGGMNLLDLIVGYDRAILVDAISTPEGDIGDVMVLDPMEVPSSHSANPHDVSFPEALEVARKMGGKRIPDEIVLVAINIRPSFDFFEGLSDEVTASIPIALDRLNSIVG